MSAVELRCGGRVKNLENGESFLAGCVNELVSLTDDLFIIFHSDGWFTYNGIATVGKGGQTIKFVCAGAVLASNLEVTAGKYGGKVRRVERVASEGNVDTYTITLDNGNTSDFTIVHECEGGKDGVGIANIEKTGWDGLVDTYTITLTDGTSYPFTVTNGDTVVVEPDGSFGITDIVDQVLERLPRAEGVGF